MSELHNNKELNEAIIQFVGNQNKNEAFQTIYRYTERYVYLIINRNVQNELSTQDLMQDVYLILYQKLDSLQNINAFQRWLGCVVTNVINDYYRKNRIEYSIDEQLDENANELVAEPESPLPLPEDIVSNKESQKYVWDIINTLPAKHRQTIVAFYFNELSIKEIAESMEIPENTVKTYLLRGKKKMSEAILNLEKVKGIKLSFFSMAPVMLMLFKTDLQACEIPVGMETQILSGCFGNTMNTASAVDNSVLKGSLAKKNITVANVKSNGVTSQISAGQTTIVSASKNTLATKVLIGALSVCVLGLGGFFLNLLLQNSTNAKVSSTIDLTKYMGIDIDDAYDNFNNSYWNSYLDKDSYFSFLHIKAMQDSESYVEISANRNDEIRLITFHGDDFSAMGFYNGMSFNDALELLNEEGFKVSGTQYEEESYMPGADEKVNDIQTVVFNKNGSRTVTIAVEGCSDKIEPNQLDMKHNYNDGTVCFVGVSKIPLSEYTELADEVGNENSLFAWKNAGFSDEPLIDGLELTNFDEYEEYSQPGYNNWGLYTYGDGVIQFDMRPKPGLVGYPASIMIAEECPFKICDVYYGMEENEAMNHMADLGYGNEITSDKTNGVYSYLLDGDKYFEFTCADGTVTKMSCAENAENIISASHDTIETTEDDYNINTTLPSEDEFEEIWVVSKSEWWYNGSFYEYTTYKYDECGFLIEANGYWYDGDEHWSSEYIRDSEGRLLESNEKELTDVDLFYTGKKYYYSEIDGYTVVEIENDDEYLSDTRIRDYYDEKGNKIKTEYLSNSVDNYNTYEYDDKGNLIKEYHYLSNGELYTTESYVNSFDDNGNLSERKILFFDEFECIEKYEYEKMTVPAGYNHRLELDENSYMFYG